MSTIVTRAGKGSALTWTEGDANFTNLNNDKLESVSEDPSPALGGNLNVSPYGIVSNTNTAIELAPGGSGDVWLTADSVRVGDINATATITTNGTGDLTLNTNAGTNSGSITIANGTNGAITIDPDSSGPVVLAAPQVRIQGTLTTNSAADLTLSTNTGTNAGTIVLSNGVNGNLTLTPNGTGKTATTNLTYNEAVYTAGSTTGTITPDCANGPVQSITLTGSITLNAFANPVSGQTLTLIVTQPSAGGPYTLSSTMKFAGGSKTLSTAANAIDIIVISYIGTTYYANLAKAFA